MDTLKSHKRLMKDNARLRKALTHFHFRGCTIFERLT